MPWTPEDAKGKTHRADTPRLQKIWATTANRVLEHTGKEDLAIKTANSVIKHFPQPKQNPSEHWSKR